MAFGTVFINNFCNFIAPGDLLYEKHADKFGPSRHYTIVFTVFVLLTLFNMINAWMVNDEFNVFSWVQNNYMFITIWTFILIVQILMTQFTQDVFSVCREVTQKFNIIGFDNDSMGNMLWIWSLELSYSHFSHQPPWLDRTLL